jgi:ubiquinone/menaquinone biosynthesis C-methylase UbiE
MDKYCSIEISGSDTDKLLNVTRRIRLAAPYLQGRPCRLLDCGCGAGGFLAAFDALPDVMASGLEFEAEKVRTARSRGFDEGRIVQGDIQDMPYSADSFDAVVLNEVLEHLPDHDLGLREVFRVLRPGGVLLIFSPNRCYPSETHGVFSRLTGKRIPHYVPFIPWVPVRLGQKIFTYPARNYWPRELRSLLSRNGFRVVGKDYVWQTFENISGAQPSWMRRTSGLLRGISMTLEKVPLIRAMGISQFLALKKSG